MNNPEKVLNDMVTAGEKKTKMSIKRLFLLSVLSGIFVACGASISSVVMHSINGVGQQRLAGGIAFPIGLIMIIFIGGELFTGDCLMLLGALQEKYSALDIIRVLSIVWIGNFVGAIFMAVMVRYSGQLDYTNGMLGAFTVKVAVNKVMIKPVTAFISGILCNIYVCAAVLIAAAAENAAGKFLGIFISVLAFVLSGYEHCVANMYYIPAGILAAKQDNYLENAIINLGITQEQLDLLNWKKFLLINEIPVTLGNIVGGMMLVSLLLYWIYFEKKNK